MFILFCVETVLIKVDKISSSLSGRPALSINGSVITFVFFLAFLNIAFVSTGHQLGDLLVNLILGTFIPCLLPCSFVL